MSVVDILGPEAIEIKDNINAVFEAHGLPSLSNDEICLAALTTLANAEESSWEETQ